MSPDAHRLEDAVAGFPRVSGDEPSGLRDTLMSMMFSPRERG